MKILVSYRGIPQSPGWATGDMVVKAFKKLGHNVMPYGNYYQTSRRLEDRNVLAEDWDLFLFLECGDGDPVYTELANIRSRKRASWFFDAALYPQSWLSILRLFEFDVNFIANNAMLYDNLKTVYLPYAADEVLHFRPITQDKYRQFGFVGSDRPERQALINHLHANKLFVELKSGIFRDEYIDFLGSSRHVINDIAGGGVGLIPMRPFEALAAGSCLITPRGDGVKSLGIPCIEYGSLDELVSICRQLYDDNIIPDNDGQEEVLRHHTYSNRCRTILEKLFPYERI